LIIHLGMSGRLQLLDSSANPQKHDHVDIVLDNQQVIRYNDPRRFGAVLWTTAALDEHKLLSHLGPEPLEKDFNADYLFKSLTKRKTTIKQFIMDQKIVVGVGNIYANEALFISKILPQREANTLSLAECTLLVSTIKSVLKTAIKHGGTTLRDFLSPEGKTGYFVQKLLVYGREDQACFDCNTTLSSLRLGNRAAVYCSSCQK
jgi:formamidopyrimidine-DNA glycosylase